MSKATESKYPTQKASVSTSPKYPARFFQLAVNTFIFNPALNLRMLRRLLIPLFLSLFLLFVGGKQVQAQANQNNFANSTPPPSTTVANLPTGQSIGSLRQVTDAQTQGNCTTGGGSALALCRFNGSVWQPIGDGGSGNLTFATSLPATGLIAEYRMPASEVSTTTLNDYSGNGNNGTFPGGGANPTRLSTGGLGFAATSSQTVALPANTGTCSSWAFAYTSVLPQTNHLAFLVQTNTYSATKAFGVGFIDSTPVNGFTSDAHYFTEIAGIAEQAGDGSTFVEHPGQGTHVMIVSAGTGSQDFIYMDGQVVAQYYTGPRTGSAGRWGNPAWQLGGFNNGFTGYFNGNIYYAACWNVALTPQQVAQANNVITTYVSQELAQPVPLSGTSYTIPIGTYPSTTDVVVIDGDSIFSGADATVEGLLGWTSELQLTGNTSTTLYVPAVVGTVMTSQMFNNIGSLDSFYNADGGRNYYLIGGGRNDFGHISSPAYPLLGNITQMCRQKKAKGFRCIVANVISDTGTSASHSYDSLLRAHWNEFADAFIDYSGDPVIGCDGCTTNLAGVHPNVWDGYAVMTYYMQRAINRLYGPQDFTNAPVYASAALASITSTSLSDAAQINTSGMSLATYTFASNTFNALGPKANGVGLSITCTGSNPAGYSNTLYSFSSTATTFTSYIPTFGLAGQTTGATCSTPLIEDKYAVLNFGAGNATIGTACGYTGQRIYLKNINAGTSTIVPTSMPTEAAETIDGAANLSIAQNQTRILESINNNSTTAPQCGWKVIQ